MRNKSSNLTIMILQSSSAHYRPVDHEAFFEGWPTKPSYELVMKHFEGSHPLFLINENSDVVAFISALTDHALYAFIALLEVRESERGKGYGKQLVTDMLKFLEGVYAIDLVCDEDLETFYQPLGFAKHSAMIQRNRDALN